jgi:2-polyprenyl-6-methoxyphenol hydroxylase-like FAD-dependent oxidoreductase
MSKRYDVAILGSGVVGQTLALLLARDRLKVALVRQPTAQPAGPDIRAYALNAAAQRLLESLRVWPTPVATHKTTARLHRHR